jgi:hypothetical protein
MGQTTFPMRDHESGEPFPADAEIDLLAQEMHTPRELVAELYASERAKIERTARIKTYVPVLIHRQVKALLRDQYRRSRDASF